MRAGEKTTAHIYGGGKDQQINVIYRTAQALDRFQMTGKQMQKPHSKTYRGGSWFSQSL